MQKTDKNQSFTAQLFVDHKPVALASKVIRKMLEAPDIAEDFKLILEKKLELYGDVLLSYTENVIPETFLFDYHDDVYTIKIEGSDGNFQSTASMEGELRNLSVFNGNDPTYFRIINRLGESSNLDDLPDELNTIRLHTGPQRREVHTYGDAPNFPVLTDYEKRGGKLVFFELKIIKRNIAM
ncbi:hypothetical protein [Pseudomonas sp. PD9R]|uniref:hypothetical protein n=1 Tax=Pseudomonas sp. PD9R TaxID=2853534 RepID=UPI001C47C3A0|nr:hypothetical protein [Pseudomonas sp. PD9R]MBV6824191.1 hypothetical protein [Pseudomonas sp. PD9R]